MGAGPCPPTPLELKEGGNTIINKIIIEDEARGARI